MDPQKIQAPDPAVKIRGVVLLGKTHVGPEAVVDKMQACPIPKDMKEIQAFVRMLGSSEDFCSPPGTVPLSLRSLIKTRQGWGWGSEQRAALGKAEMLMRQTETLGICQAGLPFEFNVSLTPDGMDWALRPKQEKETVPPKTLV